MAKPPVSRPAPQRDDLVGVWYGEIERPAAHAGQIELRRRAAHVWVASYEGSAGDVHIADSKISFQVKGAEFHGVRRAGAIEGFWVQAPIYVSGRPMATPLRLDEAQSGVFRGSPAGMRDRLRLYLVIERAGGALRAFVRNPEFNLGLRFGSRRIDRDGAALVFIADDRRPSMTGTLDDSEHMTVRMDSFVVRFTRPEPSSPTLSGFWLRPAGKPRYRYRPPPATDDGWEVAGASQVGVAPGDLEALVNKLATYPCTENLRSLCPHSVVLAKDGKLILEAYFAGHTPDTPHDMRSAGKSLATTMIGFAVDRKKLRPSDRVVDILKAYAPIDHNDARKRAMTVGHLMSMSSGLSCDDNDPSSPGNEDRLQPETAGEDFGRYIIDLPMVGKPGVRGVYCSASMHMLSPILEAATGTSSAELVHRWFVRPLDIATYHLNLSPKQRAYFGGGIYLRPRDMAKLGQVFVGGGTWRGRRIISEDWIRQATSPHARLNATDFDDYGYGWWLRTYTVAGRRVPAFYASGNGGQLIFGFPQLNAVVTFTAGNYYNYSAWKAFIEDVVPHHVLPAVLAARARSVSQ